MHFFGGAMDKVDLACDNRYGRDAWTGPRADRHVGQAGMHVSHGTFDGESAVSCGL